MGKISGRRMLVVDDDPTVRDSVCETLSRAGHHVESVPDGEDALALVSDRVPDLIVCDLVMPRLDGPSAIRKMRERGIDVPILAVSGGSQNSDGPALSDAVAAGADATLEKPFGARALLKAVNELLDK